MSQLSKSSDKKLKSAELKVHKLIAKIESFKLNNAYISKLDINREKKATYALQSNRKLGLLMMFVVLTASVLWIYKELPTSSNCFLQLPSISKSIFRPPEDCSMCAGVKDVVRIANITAGQFEDLYAYGTTPVIVTDATDGWKALTILKDIERRITAGNKVNGAMSALMGSKSLSKNARVAVHNAILVPTLLYGSESWEFNFKFFADFYRNGKMGSQINDCFYFAYKSGLNSLQEVFAMDEMRANLSGEPWYVGWSTCYDDETRALRGYYKRPYFLPRTAESDMVDWIFIGGPGQGAHMHVDSVKHMSWQAQIRGNKQWELAPPPECLYHCSWLKFQVAPGEILVVDTNRWYHKTNVLPGDISITIGAEYD